MALRNVKAVLAESSKEMHKGESYEKALGKVIRRHGGTYDDYIHLIGQVRAHAKEKEIELRQAARELSAA